MPSPVPERLSFTSPQEAQAWIAATAAWRYYGIMPAVTPPYLDGGVWWVDEVPAE